MSKTLIAIDVGKRGGFAVGGPDLTAHFRMPDTEGDILQAISELKVAADIEGRELLALVENVPVGMAGKGSAMSKLNANAGFIRGCLMALKIRTILVRPVEWQKHFSLGTRSACKSDNEWKNKLKAEAQRRFPKFKVTLNTADALLILEYGRKQNL